MPNIKAKIHKHNKSILEKAQQKSPDTQLCNCANKYVLVDLLSDTQ